MSERDVDREAITARHAAIVRAYADAVAAEELATVASREADDEKRKAAWAKQAAWRECVVVYKGLYVIGDNRAVNVEATVDYPPVLKVHSNG